MKKNLLTISLIAACMAISSCGKSTENNSGNASNANEAASCIKIAYVELDTLMSQYQLYIDYSQVLSRKGNNIEKTLMQKQRTLESHAATFQKKYESNQFTTRDQVEREQNKLQQEQMEMQELAARLNSEFEMEQARINTEARDSIQAFLKDYNKTHQYDYVMIKAGDNLLIANPKYNITGDVIKGLNKRYKISPEVAEQINAEE
jgi:outer membrane protein